MEKIELAAIKRSQVGKKVRLVRKAGRVPAVLYGRGVKTEPLEIEAPVLERVYRYAGGNKIVALKVGEGRARNVLIHDVQLGAERGELRHVDFYVVRMDEELKAEVPIHFTGESTAVYQDGGTLVKNTELVEVECLPADLPQQFEVDIAVLDDFEKTITLGDLVVPSGVKLVEENLVTVIAKVEPPRTEEEMAELDEPVDEAAEMPEGVQEEEPIVVSEENEGDKDRRDSK
jgi:large subunit ribosomal protein L25